MRIGATTVMSQPVSVALRTSCQMAHLLMFMLVVSIVRKDVTEPVMAEA
jgi:hypothetical protein